MVLAVLVLLGAYFANPATTKGLALALVPLPIGGSGLTGQLAHR
jgi:hypothetical protein